MILRKGGRGSESCRDMRCETRVFCSLLSVCQQSRQKLLRQSVPRSLTTNIELQPGHCIVTLAFLISPTEDFLGNRKTED